MDSEQHGFQPIDNKENETETGEKEHPINDEQEEHLRTKLESVSNPEKQVSVVDYIKNHIESDLSSQPQMKYEVAKVLDKLLKLSKSGDKDYILQPLIMIDKLEKDLRIKDLFSRTPIDLHETKKAAVNFEQLNDNDRKEIEKYIQGLFE
jgi:hypothetical protein